MTAPTPAATRIERNRVRLDEALVARGIAASRSRARALIMAGDVRLNGQVVLRAGAPVRDGDGLELTEKSRYASRGGDKLEHALDAFGIDPTGLVVADFGASTGGFTDCLLQRGAARVYAVDVGRHQLADRLRLDPRVVVLDRTNARYLDALPEPIDLVTIDVSFISLDLILPSAAAVLKPGGAAVTLIKPQFEAGRRDVGKGGVVRDVAVHQRVLADVLGSARRTGFVVDGLTASPLLGPAGNREFLALLRLGAEDNARDVACKDEEMIEGALAEAVVR